MYILAYLIIPITINIGNVKKHFKKGQLIRVNPYTHSACVEQYIIMLDKKDYAIIQ